MARLEDGAKGVTSGKTDRRERHISRRERGCIVQQAREEARV